MTSLLELFIEVEDLLKLRLHFLARFLKLKNGQVLVLEPSTLSTQFNQSIPSTPKLQTALARVLDELERNQKKENHLHTISKMMGTLVHVQLYTFSYRKPVIRPQNMPKTADWG